MPLLRLLRRRGLVLVRRRQGRKLQVIRVGHLDGFVGDTAVRELSPANIDGGSFFDL